MIYGLLFAFIGYAFSRILLEDVLLFYSRFLHRLPEWVGKPLGLCAVCFTGQLSLWGMLPMVDFTYIGILHYLGIVSLNMILVKILIYAIKED